MAGVHVAPPVVLFLHDLFTVVWVGGMIVLAAAVLPAVRGAVGAGPELFRVMGAVQARLRWFAWVSIAGLIVTGVFLARRSPEFGGFFAFGDAYSAALSLKHLVVLAMVAVALVRALVLVPRRPPVPAATGPAAGQGAGRSPQAPRPRGGRASVALLVMNASLGVVVLLLSAYTAVV